MQARVLVFTLEKILAALCKSSTRCRCDIHGHRVDLVAARAFEQTEIGEGLVHVGQLVGREGVQVVRVGHHVDQLGRLAAVLAGGAARAAAARSALVGRREAACAARPASPLPDWPPAPFPPAPPGPPRDLAGAAAKKRNGEQSRQNQQASFELD